MIYQEFKETVIGIAQEMGIADYELYYTEGDSVSVEIYQEEVKGYSVEDDLGVCFRCVVDGKAGYASTENLTEEEARSLVVRALDNAESIESEEEVFLHEKGDTYAVCPQDTSVRPTGGELIEGALALQRKMYQADPRVADGTQAVMLYGRQKYALCNSKGLDLEDVISLARCYGMPLVSEGGEMYDGFESKKGRLQDFDLDAIAEKAVEHAVSAIGADSVPSGKYDVVFSNKTMAALLQTYASVFSAEQAQKGMSLLKGKEGERIAAPFITIVDDPRYEENIRGAIEAGIPVGVYFFTQALDEVEAVEEASMALNLVSGYGLEYPIFLDVEASGGRGDAIDAATRTAVCRAFCATIQNSGYKAGIYANKTWLSSKIKTGSLTDFKIWLAQYASAPSYTSTRYDMWQYTSKGSV